MRYDTKTLVVGQEVCLASGPYTCRGKVVEVTPEGVVVQATEQQNITSTGDLFRFDKNGKGLDRWGTFECGPWDITALVINGKIVLTEFGRTGK